MKNNLYKVKKLSLDLSSLSTSDKLLLKKLIEALTLDRECLLEAAPFSRNASLKDFLMKRAFALETDDFFESERAWLQLDSDIDITFWPSGSEVELIVGLKDREATERLNFLRRSLRELEAMLPIDEKYKRPRKDHEILQPVSVINLLWARGATSRVPLYAAFNLPDDEKITLALGNKQVLVKNVQEDRFYEIGLPLAQEALLLKKNEQVSFETSFLICFAHELAHSLGPKEVFNDSKKHFLVLEECKATALGLYLLQKWIDRGELSKDLEESLYPTFLTLVIRAARRSFDDAESISFFIQFNHYLSQGAIAFDPQEEKFFIKNREVLKKSIEKLASDLLTLQAEGDFSKANNLALKGAIDPYLKKMIQTKLSHLPIDIHYDFSHVKGAIHGHSK